MRIGITGSHGVLGKRIADGLVKQKHSVIPFQGDVRKQNEVLEWSENEKSGYFGKYEGEIENDKPTGKGKIEYPDGSSYVGMWLFGKRNGRGTSFSADG